MMQVKPGDRPKMCNRTKYLDLTVSQLATTRILGEYRKGCAGYPVIIRLFIIVVSWISVGIVSFVAITMSNRVSQKVNNF
jgi:hypothetical protein